ncbi:hypothetical protein L218DRAFT_223849 [Marasmius fiardii PR-910]|nr:hypothetical protein L218DRAFT_223849 [Marasmius fiardii PR-910]
MGIIRVESSERRVLCYSKPRRIIYTWPWFGYSIYSLTVPFRSLFDFRTFTGSQHSQCKSPHSNMVTQVLLFTLVAKRKNAKYILHPLLHPNVCRGPLIINGVT